MGEHSLWDGFQREVLVALGHTLLVPAGSRANDAARPGAASTVEVAGTGDSAQPPLLRALVRAGGGDLARLGALPALDTLRTPAAKRALWPRLRRLRRLPTS